MCPSLPLSRIKNTRYLSLSMETKHTPSNGTCTHETSWRHNRTTYASNIPRRRHSINLFTSLSLDHFFMTSRQPIQPTNARSWRHTFSCTLRTRMFTARMLSSLLPYWHLLCSLHLLHMYILLWLWVRINEYRWAWYSPLGVSIESQ